MAKQDLKNQIAGLLRDQVQQLVKKGITTLPGVKKLAAWHGVSRNIMLAALNQLRDEKVVSFQRGSNIRIEGAVPNESSRHDMPAGVSYLYNILKEQILKGEIRAHEPLPKTAYLVSQYHVSYSTIAAACRRLAREGYVHKKGKRYIAGAVAEKRQSASPSSGRKCILLIQSHDQPWQRYAQSEFLAPFANSFYNEIKRADYSLLFHVLKTDSASALSIQDQDLLRRQIQSGRHAVAGILLCGFQPAEGPLQSLIGFCGTHSLPAVWLNADNATIARAPLQTPFYNCHVNEREAVRAALEVLYKEGHRGIGVPIQNTIPWMHQRVECIRAEARRISPAIEVIPAWLDRGYWAGDETPAEKIRRLSESGAAPLRNFLKQLLKQHPDMLDNPLMRQRNFYKSKISPIDRFERFIIWNTALLVPLLKYHGITALIAPCDLFARGYMQWLSLAGIKVPDELSIVSFNNYIEFSTLPLTSIDFGLDYMGYAAFHAIAGDIPLNIRGGEIAGEVRLIDRGSVGKPRADGITADLQGELF